MADIRYVCLSDMHLGEEDSLLTDLQQGSTDIDPLNASPVMKQLVECIKHLVSQISPKPALILNGDILEMALSTVNEAAMVFERFIELIMPDGDPLFEKIIYIPGNHDHHLWETAREIQYANYIENRTEPAQRLQTPWHTTEMFFENDTPKVDSYFLTKLVQRYEHLEDFKIHVAYPNFGLFNESNQKSVIFHHGHYIESLYHLMSTLKGMIFPDQKRKLKNMEIKELEAENFAWIDFFWSAMGRSGAAGKDVEIIYESLNDPKARKKLLRNLANGLADVIDIPILTEAMEARAMEKLLVFFANKFAGTEKLQTEQLLSETVRQGLVNYMIGPLKKQLLKERSDDMPYEVTFVIGHTHKPFEEDWDEMGYSGYPQWVNIFNTGGWVVESEKVQPKHGGSVVLVDEDLNTVALRMYNEAKRPEDFSVQLKDATHPNQPPNPLFTQISQQVNFADDPWRNFSSRVYEELRIRRANLYQRINIRD